MSRFRLGSIVALAGILIVGGGCAESPSAPVRAGTELQLLRAESGANLSRSATESASRVIGPEGGVIELAQGHRLVFPAGALSQPTEIGMRADAEFQGVRLSPHGLQFPAGREPVLTLRASTGAEARGFASLVVTYVDEGASIVEVLPTTRQGNTLTANLEHFSGYIIGGDRQSMTMQP